MVGALLFVGLLVAILIGFNTDGSSTGASFGPAVGGGILRRLAAAALMTGFALPGGWTLGRGVVTKMGDEIVPQNEFTLTASVVVFFFVGLALLVSNTFGVPASTSMVTVGAIASLGLINESLDSRVMFETIPWWIVASVAAFWTCAAIGRYIHPYLGARFKLDRSPGTLVKPDRDGGFPRSRFGPNTTYREFNSTILVVVVACYTAFLVDASDTTNAIAPLVGNGTLETNTGILTAGGIIDLGAFTITRRTFDTVGSDLTQSPILVVLIVKTVSASFIFFPSVTGTPASPVVSATIRIIGLGWGRATRAVTLDEALSGGGTLQVSTNAFTAEHEDEVPRMGEEAPNELSAQDLFDPDMTRQVIFFWMLTLLLSALALYASFSVGIV